MRRRSAFVAATHEARKAVVTYLQARIVDQAYRLAKLTSIMRSSLLAMLATLALLATLVSPTQASAPYLCKCTCFLTNSTIVPIYKPQEIANPCSTCTRQFCLDQNLAGCQGARIENPNADTGTGFEGEVWARCFREQSRVK